MSEQLMDVLSVVREALDVPQGASAAGARIRGKVLNARADRVVALLTACAGGDDVADGVAELRGWLARNPIRYVTVEQARDGAVAVPPQEFRTYVEPGSVLPLPRGELPPWVGPSYLAKLWSVHPAKVTRWADAGLLTASWRGSSRRFSREAVLEFVRYAIPVRLLEHGMVVQHPDWADGMPVWIGAATVGERQLWHVVYRVYGGADSSRTYEAAAPCRGTRMVLRYPITKSTS